MEVKLAMKVHSKNYQDIQKFQIMKRTVGYRITKKSVRNTYILRVRFERDTETVYLRTYVRTVCNTGTYVLVNEYGYLYEYCTVDRKLRTLFPMRECTTEVFSFSVSFEKLAFITVFQLLFTFEIFITIMK